jgi:hypothetical protein
LIRLATAIDTCTNPRNTNTKTAKNNTQKLHLRHSDALIWEYAARLRGNPQERSQ